MIISAILTIIAAYLIGSINFAVIFAKVFLKKDVRELGSGNAGATNVLRNAGVLPGVLTFICDALKGFVASYMGYLMFGYLSHYTTWALAIYGAYACGTACMLGHVFPVYYQFKGGKGVATSVGIFAVCCWPAIVIGLVVFALVTLISKYVSLASLVATVTVVTFSIWLYDYTASLYVQAFFIIVMGSIVILKHSTNIKRLLNGTESKIGKGGKK